MQSQTLTKLDFISALVLIALGFGVIIESLRMPRLENLNINPYTVPGLVPGVLGAVLLVLGGVLLIRSIARGGWRITLTRAGLRALLTDAGLRRLALALMLTIAYALGLIGRLPFWLATFLFVFFFIVLFERMNHDQTKSSAFRFVSLLTALLQAVLTSAVVTVVFQEIFLVRLP